MLLCWQRAGLWSIVPTCLSMTHRINERQNQPCRSYRGYGFDSARTLLSSFLRSYKDFFLSSLLLPPIATFYILSTPGPSVLGGMVWREGQHCALVALSRAKTLLCAYLCTPGVRWGFFHFSVWFDAVWCILWYQVPWFLWIPLEYYTIQNKERWGTGELKRRHLDVFSSGVKNSCV